jgi:hypothetical protein
MFLFVFVMETKCVFCHARTETLNVILVNAKLPLLLVIWTSHDLRPGR